MCITLDRETSRLSVLSTSTSENQTLRVPVEDGVPEDVQVDNNAMDVDIPVLEDSEMSSPLTEARSDIDIISSAKTTEKAMPPLRNIIHAPDGTIIVETLDTPLLRRQKSIRRKAERLRLAAEAEASASASAGPSRLPAISGSGSSSLTDLDGDEEEDGKRHSRATAPPPEPKDPAVVVLGEGEILEGGTLGTC